MKRLGCTAYKAGHQVHWIQALHTENKPKVFALSWRGQLLQVVGEVLTIAREDGSTVLLRNHDAARALAFWRPPIAVLMNDQYAILRVAGYCMSVQTDTGLPLSACPMDELPEDVTDAELTERLTSHGGYSVPVHRRRSDRPVSPHALEADETRTQGIAYRAPQVTAGF